MRAPLLILQTIVRTKENVEKKQALTYEEMEAEREEVREILPSLFTGYLRRKAHFSVILLSVEL